MLSTVRDTAKQIAISFGGVSKQSNQRRILFSIKLHRISLTGSDYASEIWIKWCEEEINKRVVYYVGGRTWRAAFVFSSDK